MSLLVGGCSITQEKFQRYKVKLVTVQNNENANFSTSIENIRSTEEELIRKIKKRTEKMVQIVLDQKAHVNTVLKKLWLRYKIISYC